MPDAEIGDSYAKPKASGEGLYADSLVLPRRDHDFRYFVPVHLKHFCSEGGRSCQLYLLVGSLTLPRRLIELSPYSPSNRFFLGHIAALIPALKAPAPSLGLATPCHGIGGGITLALEML